MKHAASLTRFVAFLVIASLASWSRGDSFEEIRPILAKFCNKCHSTAAPKGELDLERFDSIGRVKQHPSVWQRVLEQLHDNEMPPKDQPQLSATEKSRLSQWAKATLDEIALSRAGDPGPVVLRRLSNAEFTYTLRDLTELATLDPAREFPVDGAAGEGFTNAGAALAMSPALLTKYLDAAKEVAGHAALTPHGIRFFAGTSQRDWTDESLARIRAFYGRYADAGGATAVNLQGVQFDTNAGGRLPLDRYLAAAAQERAALESGSKSVAQVAHDRGLNAKYMGILWNVLHDAKRSLLLDMLRTRWRAGRLTAADIEAWQQSLWRFASVGHIGKLNGPKAWQEPVSPLTKQHELRFKLPAPANNGDVTIYLAVGDAGDGKEHDFALWENPRLVAPGRAELPLRDVRAVATRLASQREIVIATAANCLAAASEADAAARPVDIEELARRHRVPAELLAGWLKYLGVVAGGEPPLGPLLVNKLERTPDYNFIQGWTGDQALSVIANSSDAAVRVPGIMKPHSVAAHPAPNKAIVIAWKCPLATIVQIRGSVQDAHPECGNGVAWRLELRRGLRREQLASGTTSGAAVASLGSFPQVRVLEGDLVAIVVEPRDGNHVCDLTAIDLTLKDGTREWDLARDLSPDILAQNPHPDRQGNPQVWHLCGEPVGFAGTAAIPADSLPAKWRAATDPAERSRLTEQLQHLLKHGIAAEPAQSPNRIVYQQLLTFPGPLLSVDLQRLSGNRQHPGGQAHFAPKAPQNEPVPESFRIASQHQAQREEAANSPYGLDPALFGRHPHGGAVEANSLCVQAPSVIEVRLPAALADGAELVATGRLHAETGAEGSVQMQVLPQKPELISGIVASKAEAITVNGQWSDNNLRTMHQAAILVNENSQARDRFERAFDDFRQLFPIALCYTKIVPVDEVVTLTLFYREDQHLKRLMLDAAQAAELDRLWEELLFVSEAPLKQVDVFEQLYQFATQDANPAVFEPLRAPILQAAADFKARQAAVEPLQIQAVLDFAALAWRRPLTPAELAELRGLYSRLREQELSHPQATRTLLTRVLLAPAFLYRGEQPAPGNRSMPVSDWELATRLSYFLWSSAPDDELRQLASAGKLHDTELLAAQARRMLQDAKVRRLATEFGCQWLQIRDLETLDEKSERHFPTFLALRGDMQEEAVRFFMDLFQADRTVISLLDADHTFLNGPLARHYGIPVKSEEWQRVDGMRHAGRGGILGLAGALARQSGASRTSPILRGNWLCEVVLGERLPRPPGGVPVLPEEAPRGLTERQLIERHSSEPSCATCHRRIDPFGFALEGFDAIGRLRDKDAAGQVVDTAVTLPDGTKFTGLAGLRAYLLAHRREEFRRQFCRKLLGFALGRGVQLSDKPLLDAMLAELSANDDRVAVAIELIVTSQQFRHLRGRDDLATKESELSR